MVILTVSYTVDGPYASEAGRIAFRLQLPDRATSRGVNEAPLQQLGGRLTELQNGRSQNQNA